MANKTLDLGNLSVQIGTEFKLVGDVLTVPAGSTIDQIAEFLESLTK
jgi:hypothetical protein